MAPCLQPGKNAAVCESDCPRKEDTPTHKYVEFSDFLPAFLFSPFKSYPLSTLTPLHAKMQIKFREVYLASHRKYARTSRAFPGRWITTSRVLEAILAHWPALETHYREHQGQATTTRTFPLVGRKELLMEIYSVIKPVAAIIERAEARNPDEMPQAAPAGPTSITSLVDLATTRLTVADPTKPLLIHTPQTSASSDGGGTGALGSAAYDIAKTPRRAVDLHAATTATRALLGSALGEHFFGPRYDEAHCGKAENGGAVDGVGEVDYIFEMTACMDPFLSQLSLVDSLASSPAYCTRVKSAVWDKVLNLAVSLVEAAEMDADERHRRRRQKGEEEKLEREKGKKRRRLSEGGGVYANGDKQGGGIGRAADDEGSTSDENGPKDTGNIPHEGTGLTTTNPNHQCSREHSYTSSADWESRGDRGKAAAAEGAEIVPTRDDNVTGRNSSPDFDVSYILESGIFGSVSSTPVRKVETHRSKAEAELDAFKALGAKRTFGMPPLNGLWSFWVSEGTRDFPYLARVARVLLGFPTSSSVSESGVFSGADARLRRLEPEEPEHACVTVLGADGVVAGDSLNGEELPLSDRAYAEMVLFLHRNEGIIPTHVPVLSRQQASASIPRRWR